MSSIQPRKQRKALHNAPGHVRRKQVASHLSEELLLKYNRRSLTLRAGDEVKVMRGQYRGASGKVVAVDVQERTVTVEGVVNKKADGTEVPRPIHPSNLLIVRLDLEDARRRAKLGETAEADRPAKPARKPKATAKPAAKAPKAEKEATA